MDISPLSLSRVSGWIVVAAILVTICLPYLSRRSQLWSAGRTLLQRLRPHYWLGYAITLIIFLHAIAAVRAGGMKTANPAGIYLATFALFTAIAQVFLGLLLREPSVRQRPRIQRQHFIGMLLLVALILGHVLLNKQ